MQLTFLSGNGIVDSGPNDISASYGSQKETFSLAAPHLGS
jgi:hypothetical protein